MSRFAAGGAACQGEGRRTHHRRDVTVHGTIAMTCSRRRQVTSHRGPIGGRAWIAAARSTSPDAWVRAEGAGGEIIISGEILGDVT